MDVWPGLGDNNRLASFAKSCPVPDRGGESQSFEKWGPETLGEAMVQSSDLFFGFRPADGE
jgi:hypothetical protein